MVMHDPVKRCCSARRIGFDDPLQTLSFAVDVVPGNFVIRSLPDVAALPEHPGFFQSSSRYHRKALAYLPVIVVTPDIL